jgi:ribose transport system permease protein
MQSYIRPDSPAPADVPIAEVGPLDGARDDAAAAQTPAPMRPRGTSALSTLGSRYALIGVWVAMAAIYLILMPSKVWQVTTLQSIFGSQQVLVVLALAALSTLVVGEFDLSFASIMGISATIIPVLSALHHVSLVLSCLAALAACVLCGALNAFFVVKLGVSSLVVTLGTGTLLVGIAEAISGSSTVALISTGFSKLALYPVLGMPISFYYGVALAILFAYVNGWTPLGRHMLFVGSNPEVARLAGIKVNRIRAGSYIVGSLLAGFAGIILISSVGGYDPTGSSTYLLPALAAVFLGSAAVQPGQFNPIGTLIGIYFLETGIFGLQLLGFSGWIQNVFYGGGLVVAVACATIIRHRAKQA